MAALPYMQLYVADYLGDTFQLTTEEHGAYLLILMTYWQSGKAIHKDRLAKAARLSNERWATVEQTLNEYFIVDEKGYWYHARMEHDLESVLSKQSQRSLAGKASAQKRLKNKVAQLTENKEKSNDRSTTVEQTLNDTRSQDTDTDTDTKKEKDKKKTALAMLTEMSVEKEIAREFIAVRKTKRLTNTQTAFNMINKQVGLAELSMNDAITLCVQNSWGGFKAEWLEDKNNGTSGNKTVPSEVDNSATRHHNRLKKRFDKAVAEELGTKTVQQVSSDIQSQVDGGD